MTGLGFDSTLVIWLVLFLGVFMSVLYSIHYFTVKTLKEKSSPECVEKHLESFNSQFKLVRNVIILLWVIISIIMIAFHGTTIYVRHDDMGSEITKQETMKYEPPSMEKIETLNTEIIEKEEDLRERRIEEEETKSRNDYNRFIEDSLKTVN